MRRAPSHKPWRSRYPARENAGASSPASGSRIVTAPRSLLPLLIEAVQDFANLFQLPLRGALLGQSAQHQAACRPLEHAVHELSGEARLSLVLTDRRLVHVRALVLD